MTTYRVRGQHAISVASGYFETGDTGVKLTEDEARDLTSAGAVEPDGPAPKEPKPSAGLPNDRGSRVPATPPQKD